MEESLPSLLRPRIYKMKIVMKGSDQYQYNHSPFTLTRILYYLDYILNGRSANVSLIKSVYKSIMITIARGDVYKSKLLL